MLELEIFQGFAEGGFADPLLRWVGLARDGCVQLTLQARVVFRAEMILA